MGMGQERKQLIHEPGEFLYSNGQTVILCVLCELSPNKDITKQAITVLDGLALCREHMNMVAVKMVNAARIDLVPADLIMACLNGDM